MNSGEVGPGKVVPFRNCVCFSMTAARVRGGDGVAGNKADG